MDEKTLAQEPYRSLRDGHRGMDSFGQIAEEQKNLKAEADKRWERHRPGTKGHADWKEVDAIIQDRIDAALDLQEESAQMAERAQEAVDQLPEGRKALLTPEARKSVGWEPLTRQERKSLRREFRRER